MKKWYMNQFVVVSLLLLLPIGLASCTIAKISGRGSQPLVLNNLPTKVNVIEHFTESKMVTFDYTSSFDVSEVIAERLSTSGADAITNITITVKTDPGTFFVNFFTLGIANARTFEVEGDLVEVPGGFGSLLDDSELLDNSLNLYELKEYYKNNSAKIDQYPSIVKIHGGYVLVNELE